MTRKDKIIARITLLAMGGILLFGGFPASGIVFTTAAVCI